MRGWTIGVATMALAAPLAAWGQLQTPRSISMQRAPEGWRPAVFVCDAIDGDRVLVLSAPDKARRAMLSVFARPGLAGQQTPVRIGAGDAGAGQIWYPLLDGAGQSTGAVHAVNPGMVDPPATTPAIVGVRWAGHENVCRFMPQTRILGVTARRSIQITQTPTNGYRYRSYNADSNLPELPQAGAGHDTRASLTIDNGRLVDQRGGRRVFEFNNAGYVYRVLASVDTTKGGGGVQVWRDGCMVLAEPFVAYTAALAV